MWSGVLLWFTAFSMRLYSSSLTFFASGPSVLTRCRTCRRHAAGSECCRLVQEARPLLRLLQLCERVRLHTGSGNLGKL